jgi:HEAT repeat protein
MAIRGALKDQEPLVRREAAVSLGKIGGKEDVVLLLDPASNDTDPYVRKAASEAIEKIGRRSGAR